MATGPRGRGALKGHNGDKERVRSKRVRTRGKVRGSRSSDRADGGVVALRFVLMSCFLGLLDHAPLALYRLDSFVRLVRYGRWDSSVAVVRYGRALRAVKEVVAKSKSQSQRVRLALVTYRRSNRARGTRRHVRLNDTVRRGVELRRV